MPTDAENVCSLGWTGSGRPIVKTALLTHSRRRCCARPSGKRILCGRYCPEGQLLAGRKSDAILREKPPCQQLNEGENDALTPTRRARHCRVLRNHGCRDTCGK